MGTTSTAVVNNALEMIGQQVQIESLTDGSIAANAANEVYAPIVQLLLRQLNPDFAYALAILTPAAQVTSPWAYEYIYPADCMRALQVRPPSGGAGALDDPFDPQPVAAKVGYDPQGGAGLVPAKVIFTNQQNAWLNYTTSNVTEAQWDPSFAEAASRRLANPLAMALAGRPDFAREILEESERFAGVAEFSDEPANGAQGAA
jgi:hypothetical protein